MSVVERGKAVWAWFARTQLWRAWKRYGDRRGNRLAGATSFFGFLSLFPLILLAAAVIGRTVPSAVDELKTALAENLPGISENIDLDSLVENAGSIGLIAGVSLLFTGLGWIDSLRASIRSMHELDDQPGNPVQLKLVDLGALVGLGAVGGLATAASSVLSGLSNRIVDWVGLDGTWLANWGLQAISLVLGIGAGAVLFLYLETAMPRVALPRKVALIAALVGGIVFYAAQQLGKVYVQHVIGTNAAYGTLALPLALLVWVYLLTRVIMLIAAWAKEATLDHRWHTGQAEAAARAAMPFDTDPAPRPTTGRPKDSLATARLRSNGSTNPAPDENGLLPGPPGKRFKVVPIPARRADTVAVAAGALLGATATAFTVHLTRALRSFRS